MDRKNGEVRIVVHDEEPGTGDGQVVNPPVEDRKAGTAVGPPSHGNGAGLPPTVRDDDEGLSTQQAEELQRQHGFNEVKNTEKPEWRKILQHYLGIIPFLMFVTAILSVAVTSGDGRRGWVSFGLLIFELNLVCLLSYYSDRNVGSALSELQKLSAPTCIARRDGKWRDLEVRELVPGDAILLRGGDVIPADGRICGVGEPLAIDESSLTGESLAVSKDAGDDVLSGAVVSQGERHAVVTATGAGTFFGKTMTLLSQDAQDSGHLQQVLNKVAYMLTAVGAAACLVIFIVVLARKDYNVGESFVIAFVILVAVVPIGMPLVTTAVLAVGAREMARNKAIVSRLSAMEEMSGMEVLCSDKTGTLTKNELTLERQEIAAWGTYSVDDVLLYAALAARWENQDAIDSAVTGALQNDRSHLTGYQVARFVPFNPVAKRTEAQVERAAGGTILVTKGAPHIIGELVDELAAQERVEEFIAEKAQRGLRALGVAISHDMGASWQLVGQLALLDPPREDSAETIQKAQALGIEVKMITGDQRAIAIETSRRLGLGTNIVPATEMRERIEADGLAELVDSADGFAGVYPEHKFQIVQELQRRGHLVGMTGDGVNDAPALKKANVGIAVAGATEAAKAAADIILTAPGLSTIITAITRSRKIFSRLEAYITYRIASSVLILLFFFFSIICVQFDFPTWVLILLSLVNDFTVMATSVDKVYSSKTPMLWKMGRIVVLAVAIGTVAFTGSFLLLFLARPSSWNWWHLFNIDFLDGRPERGNAKVVAVMFLQLAVAIQLNILSTRNPLFFWYFSKRTVPRPSWLLLLPVAASCAISTFIAVYWPHSARLGGGAQMDGIGWAAAGVVWAWAITWFVLADVVKVLVARAYDSFGSNDFNWGALVTGTGFARPTEALRRRMAHMMRRENRVKLAQRRHLETPATGEGASARPGGRAAARRSGLAGARAEELQSRLEALERESQRVRAAIRLLLERIGPEGSEHLRRLQSHTNVLQPLQGGGAGNKEHGA
eukprot:jgi/Mesen1/5913/ME000030S05179